MSLETRITSFATAVAAALNDTNSNVGTMASLSTANKSSLVAALNELKAELDSFTSATIDDSATSSTTSTWSVDKISNAIATAIDQVLDGAPSALDTLNEIAAALNDDAGVISGILAAQALRVRVDAVQSFDSTQKAQGRSNIGAQEAAAIGNTDRDFAADFTGALT